VWQDYAQVISGALAGALLCVGVAKYAITKSLKDLERALDMCENINLRLAVISTKIEDLDALTDIVHQHDRQIVALESRRHAPRN
jgi:hypothetical protein